MRFGFLGFVFLASTLLANAQGSPEEEAITDILLAKDSAAVEKHLPEALQKALDLMNKGAREQLLSKPRVMMQGKGLTASQTNDGQALLAFDAQSEDSDIKHFELRTQRRISNGVEAVLLLNLVATEKSWGDVEVWMKLEQGEWRITEFTDPNGYGKLNLEDPDTIAEIVQTLRMKTSNPQLPRFERSLRLSSPTTRHILKYLAHSISLEGQEISNQTANMLIFSIKNWPVHRQNPAIGSSFIEALLMVIRSRQPPSNSARQELRTFSWMSRKSFGPPPKIVGQVRRTILCIRGAGGESCTSSQPHLKLLVFLNSLGQMADFLIRKYTRHQSGQIHFSRRFRTCSSVGQMCR